MRTILVLLVAVSAVAQGPSTPPPGSPVLHLVQKTNPVYPPIAKAAHVSGQVKLRVEIGVDGRVTGTKVISGPPMLVGAAVECVRQWVYEPALLDGKPVSTSTTVTIPFDLPAPVNPNDEKIAAKFFPLDQDCIKAVSANIDPVLQAQSCKEAADVAATFSDQERFIERRSAFVYASTAMLRNEQLKEALEYANQAVAVVEQGRDDGSGSSAAYGVRAQVEARLGDLPAASKDLTRAEDFEREAMADMGKMNPDFAKRQYVPVLRGLLNFHAGVLTALGKQAEADAKTAEARAL